VDQAGEDESSVVSSDAESNDSTNVPPAAFIVEDAAADDVDPIGLPESVIQDAVSSNEVQLSVAQFGAVAKDLAIFTYAENHDLTEAALADLLKLSCCDAKYRTPCLIRKFIEASVNVEKRQVDCCLNGCVAFTHKRSLVRSCDACGTARYTSTGKPARQMTYWPVTAWLTNMLGDPILGPDMMAGMKAARSAANRNSEGQQKEAMHDWYDGLNILKALLAGLFTEDTDIGLSIFTDGIEAWRQRENFRAGRSS